MSISLYTLDIYKFCLSRGRVSESDEVRHRRPTGGRHARQRPEGVERAHPARRNVGGLGAAAAGPLDGAAACGGGLRLRGVGLGRPGQVVGARAYA